jgi:C1q domain
MAYNGSGTYVTTNPPPFTYNTIISETQMNAALADIANALSAVLVRDGQAAMTGTLNMGAQNITAIGNGTGAAPSLRWADGQGWYRPNTNELALAISTSTRLIATATGVQVIPAGATQAAVTTDLSQNAGTRGIEIKNANAGNAAYAEALVTNGTNYSLWQVYGTGHATLANVTYFFSSANLAFDATRHRFRISGADKWEIDTSSRLLNTANTQTSFRATSSASRTTTGTYSSYISEAHDHGTAFDSSTGIFTAPVAGVYLFTYIFEATLNTAGGYCQANLVCSTAGTLTTLTIAQTRSASDTFTTSASHIVKLAANETVKVNNAGNSAVVSSYCRDFGGYLLG